MAKPDEALRYHLEGRPGKIEVIPTKKLVTQRDLALAYSPGVARPCQEIEKDPSKSWDYTARGNLVGVITNGTAVLGLGDIGALASKPVMEGKGCLFKKFADIDVFDLEVDETDIDKFCDVVAALEPTFGGINLEDIAAPASFAIEEKLKERMTIPVFHDDQHGTAIISGAALVNACELTGRDLATIRIVVSGAGAAAIACAGFFVELGVARENILLCDKQGPIHDGRDDLDEYKARFASADSGARTLADAMKGADVFLGLSVGGLVDADMVRSMADRPIVFALANPDPEISYPEAVGAKDGVIGATGRSDFPNQVNNVLGFPYIFRGALDVRATEVNEAMKVACARALAALAHEPVPDVVIDAYGGAQLKFGAEYLIPTPFDPRTLWWVAPAVAQAAMESGVARVKVDIEEYRSGLQKRFGGTGYSIMRNIVSAAKAKPKRIAFPEASNPKVLRACDILADEGIAEPVLVGRRDEIERVASEIGLGDITDRCAVVEPERFEKFGDYVLELYRKRQRKGMTRTYARTLLRRSNVLAAMMVEQGDVDGVVSGLKLNYRDTIRPMLQVLGRGEGVRSVSSMYMMVLDDEVKFFSDATINVDPDAATLAEMAIQTADAVAAFDIKPRVAMISFSNFGSHPAAEAGKVREAVALVREQRPDLEIEGEMQPDLALDKALLDELYPFNQLTKEANVLVFSSLAAANAAYKVLQSLGGASAIGPILLGMARPVAVLQRVVSVDEIVNMAAWTVKMAQRASRR